ncbi:hypothetical protein RQP46_010618 [Phenoliferia psychrophenolica]
MVVFAAHQIYMKKDGLFHYQMFGNRNFAICLFALFVEGIVYFVFNNFFATEAAVLFDARPVQFALRYNAFIAGQLTGYAIFAFIAYKWRSVIPSLVVGYVMFLGAVIGLALIGTKGSDASIALVIVAGIGFAAPIALTIAIVQLSVPVLSSGLLGVATAFTTTFRSLGGAFGTAVAQAIFNSKISALLPSYIAAAAVKAGLPQSSLPIFVGGIATGNATLAATAPGVSTTILEAGGAAALEAYAESFHYIWYFMIPFIVVAMIVVSMLKSVKGEMTDHIDRPLDAKYTDEKSCNPNTLSIRAIPISSSSLRIENVNLKNPFVFTPYEKPVSINISVRNMKRSERDNKERTRSEVHAFGDELGKEGQLAFKIGFGGATAFTTTFRSLGGAFGTAVAQAIFNSKISALLPSYIAAAAVKAGLPQSSLPIFVGGIATGNATLAATAPGVSTTILEAGGAAALEAYAESFHYIWYFMIPFIVVAMIVVSMLKSVKGEMTDHIDRPLDAKYTDEKYEPTHA